MIIRLIEIFIRLKAFAASFMVAKSSRITFFFVILELLSFVIIAPRTMFLHQSHKNIIVIIIKPSAWSEGKKRLRLNIFGKQQPATYSFIVFRYVFIVQQFADVPAVHFDEVCVQGFVICVNTHYVISFTTSRRFLRYSRKWVPANNKWAVISWIYCFSSLMIKNYPYHWYRFEIAWVCRVRKILVNRKIHGTNVLLTSWSPKS